MANTTSSKCERIIGIDTIRAVCAISVTLCHIQLPAYFSSNTLRFFFKTLANGPLAVIIFFIISGFCIHLPQSNGRNLDTPIFFGKRIIRVGIPFASAYLVAILLNAETGLHLVSWSLIAESIYYMIYPLITKTAKKWGWKTPIAATTACALLALTSNPLSSDFPSYGIKITWIIGLPIWISGCYLAETIVQIQHPPPKRIIIHRAVMFLASALIELNNTQEHKTHFGCAFVLFFAAIPSFYWLKQEIYWLKIHPPPQILESFGKSSYSLYILHTTIIHIGWQAQLQVAISQPIFRLLLLAVSLASAHTFHRLIEAPSQRLAGNLTR